MFPVVFLTFIAFPATFAQNTAQQAGLTRHNYYRARHASPAMVFNTTLGNAASSCATYYATNRRIDHSCTTSGAGENLYATWGSTSVNATKVAINAVDSWYSENVDYNYGSPGDSTGVTGHFTQLVWKASTQLGFGVATVGDYTVVVGKYVPYGNVLWAGSDPYVAYRANVIPPAASPPADNHVDESSKVFGKVNW